MTRLKRLLTYAKQAVDLTPTEYVIVKKVHPKLRSNAGYYAVHDRKVWHWVQNKQQATVFHSYELADAAVKGSMVNVYHYYEIERL